MKSSHALMALLVLCSNVFFGSVNAQAPVQTVRGRVLDKASGVPLNGVVVVLVTTDPLKGDATDEEGRFRITDVPVGRHNLVFRYTGYREEVIAQIIVGSGKEVVLEVQMEEDISNLSAVEIVAETDKRESINQMSTVSARMFSVEETQKFAAAVNDPGRMAQSFAGVVSADDGSNQISIRGNSPYGLLWRMEGIDIPNPNHFASAAAAGGGISILSAQTLANSDFLTGAFAAEYGNALGGVFDLRLRKGNNEKREYTVQAGLMGLDVAAEGPLARGSKGSFLLNYRYSTLTLLGKIGVPLGDAVTNFQDISYNVILPTERSGTFQVFGFGGLSSQYRDASRDSLKWESTWDRHNERFHSNTGAFGLKHTIRLSDASFLTTTAMISGNNFGFKLHRLDDELRPVLQYREEFLTTKLTVSSVFQNKINAKLSMRSGIYLNEHRFGLFQEMRRVIGDELTTELDASGVAHTVQPFTQVKFRVSESLTLNAGLHGLWLDVSNQAVLEPRAGLRYAVNNNQTVTLAYGLHSQMQPVGIYRARTGTEGNYNYPNQNLGFNRAHHLVAGYQRSLSKFMYLKSEVYYQHLFDVAESTDPSRPLSSLNQVENYMTDPLVNAGRGRNYGLELTVEQFTWRQMYFLISASLYQSQYQTPDGIWRSTRFNGNHAMSATAGKEWKMGKGETDRTFGANIRMIWAGGFRETPVDVAESRERGWTVRDESRPFVNKNPDYMRADVRFSIRTNKAHSTRTLALDIQNVTNRKNLFGTYFNADTGEVTNSYQVPLIPILSYKVEF